MYRKFTERFPIRLRGNDERQMEDGFGVAGLNCEGCG